ncbi:MAG TPA: peptidoglycan DD-metalloendopeptidase family protein [Noviherbaspirillum sp.]|nr:peptidoglycan DD-metalloendopeptidase family protein [Noviherbaspirillum sp.]
MRKSSFTVVAFIPVLLAACSTATRAPAPVLDRTSAARPVENGRPGVAANQVPKQADARGFYTVKRGDTLIQIALEFGQNYRDLVVWNNLANPNDIKVDQVLRVLPPETGAQTASVATTPGVEVRPLAPGAAAGTSKTSPRGDKRPYSDAALAEMQKGEGEPTPSAQASAPAASVPGSPARGPQNAAAPLPDDENISWIWPAEGRVISQFGEGRRGIAIAGQMGQPVLAAGSGKVLYAGSGIRGYGNLVIVKHTNNLLSAYAHNKTIFVKEDQTVAQGQKIAEMGNSDTDEVKLHFEIRHQGKPVDPSKFLPNR